MISHNGPELSDGFKRALNELPLVGGEDKYFEFIRNFGTHYINEVEMGAMYGEQTEFSKESFDRMLERGIKIEAAAEVSGE